MQNTSSAHKRTPRKPGPDLTKTRFLGHLQLNRAVAAGIAMMVVADVSRRPHLEPAPPNLLGRSGARRADLLNGDGGNQIAECRCLSQACPRGDGAGNS